MAAFLLLSYSLPLGPRLWVDVFARGFGAAGVTVRTPQDMAAVEAWGADPVGVLVIDAKIASDGGSWWLAEAFRAHC